MKRILVVVFVAMSIQLVRSAETPALIERPNADSGPTQISVGMWVVDISSIDSANRRSPPRSLPYCAGKILVWLTPARGLCATRSNKFGIQT
jgi:hypothetical protein